MLKDKKERGAQKYKGFHSDNIVFDEKHMGPILKTRQKRRKRPKSIAGAREETENDTSTCESVSDPTIYYQDSISSLSDESERNQPANSIATASSFSNFSIQQTSHEQPNPNSRESHHVNVYQRPPVSTSPYTRRHLNYTQIPTPLIQSGHYPSRHPTQIVHSFPMNSVTSLYPEIYTQASISYPFPQFRDQMEISSQSHGTVSNFHLPFPVSRAAQYHHHLNGTLHLEHPGRSQDSTRDHSVTDARCQQNLDLSIKKRRLDFQQMQISPHGHERNVPFIRHHSSDIVPQHEFIPTLNVDSQGDGFGISNAPPNTTTNTNLVPPPLSKGDRPSSLSNIFDIASQDPKIDKQNSLTDLLKGESVHTILGSPKHVISDTGLGMWQESASENEEHER